jgi:hypothetical protein
MQNNNIDVNNELTVEESSLYTKFWTEFLSNIGKYTTIFDGRNTSDKIRHWLSTGSGIKNASYSCVVVSKYARIELYIRQKDIYDQLLALKSDIETTFGSELTWDDLENRKGFRISIQKDGDLFNFYDQFNWGRILNFFYSDIDKFVKAIQPAIEKVNLPFQHNYSKDGFSFVEAATVAFEETDNKKMTVDEIWNYIIDKRIPLKSKGATPKSTLQSHLHRYSDNSTWDYKVGNPVFTIITNTNPLRFQLRRYVPIAVRESLEEYGFIHIDKLKEILAKHGINI